MTQSQIFIIYVFDWCHLPEMRKFWWCREQKEFCWIRACSHWMREDETRQDENTRLLWPCQVLSKLSGAKCVLFFLETYVGRLQWSINMSTKKRNAIHKYKFFRIFHPWLKYKSDVGSIIKCRFNGIVMSTVSAVYLWCSYQ